MTQQDLEYRKDNSIVPQLDFFNGGLNNIVAPPVRYSEYATMKNVLKPNGKKILGGLGGALEGAFHMATGDFGYGLGKIAASTAKTITGVADGGYIGANSGISSSVQEWEELSWEERYFIENFVPADGNLGDIVCKDGEYDEFYCGLGHRFFENGDYFEGLFMDGRILKGIYIFANGTRYLGEFDENLNFVNFGTIVYSDGTYYHGSFKDSLRDGIGAMWYTDGVYIGEWSNGMRHGEGSLKLKNGKFYEGFFENDQLVDTYD